MHIAAKYALLIGVALCGVAAGQQVVRDPQGIAALTKALTVAGGSTLLSAITDVTMQGKATYYSAEPLEGVVTVRGRGLHEFRLDASLPDGQHSWIVNATGSFAKNSDGTTLALPAENTAKIATVTFPWLTLLAAIQDTAISITNLGTVAHGGQQMQEILIQRIFPASQDPGGARSKVTLAHIFIDPATMTVKAIVDTAYAIRGLGEYPHEMQFSDYQPINGVLVPMSVMELIGGQKTTSLQLTQVSFNTGLTDADFQ